MKLLSIVRDAVVRDLGAMSEVYACSSKAYWVSRVQLMGVACVGYLRWWGRKYRISSGGGLAERRPCGRVAHGKYPMQYALSFFNGLRDRNWFERRKMGWRMDYV
jgi:hypothetical protein